jgi:hypothetical protein
MEGERHMAAATFALHFGHGAVDDLATAADDHHPLAHLLGLLHDMGREEHSAALPGEVDHDFLHDLAVDGVETTEGLIEEHQLGSWSRVPANWTFCCMPLERSSTL